MFVIKKMLPKIEKPIENNIIKLHISGDGLNLTKTRFSVVNFCFKVLNKCIFEEQKKIKNRKKIPKPKQNKIFTLGRLLILIPQILKQLMIFILLRNF